jgi:hypothetical protein
MRHNKLPLYFWNTQIEVFDWKFEIKLILSLKNSKNLGNKISNVLVIPLKILAKMVHKSIYKYWNEIRALLLKHPVLDVEYWRYCASSILSNILWNIKQTTVSTKKQKTYHGARVRHSLTKFYSQIQWRQVWICLNLCVFVYGGAGMANAILTD